MGRLREISVWTLETSVSESRKQRDRHHVGEAFGNGVKPKMIEHDVEQGSPEWYALHIGRPTASNFKRIIAPKSMRYSAGAAAYIDELIGEAQHYADGRFPPRVESWSTRPMDWGSQNEAEARAWYDMQLPGTLKARRVGFCTTDDGRFGCSPDALVDPDGGLELKCPYKPGIHVGYLRGAKLPLVHMAQVHGSLIVTGRKWWDFISYAHGLPAFVIRAEPNEFTDALRTCLERFWHEYQERLNQTNSPNATCVSTEIRKGAF